METNKKLKAKDLINVGIYTAIYIVFFFVVGMLNAIPVTQGGRNLNLCSVF